MMHIHPTHWSVRLSYRAQTRVEGGRRYRENIRVGVEADTMEQAIAAAKYHGIPDGGDQVKAISVHPQGTVHLRVDASGVVLSTGRNVEE